MNLLFVSSLYPPLSIGGYEESCFDMVEALKRKGHSVHVLTSSFKSGEAPEDKGVSRLLKVRANWGLPPIGATPWVEHRRLALELHNRRVAIGLLRAMAPDAVVIWNAGHLGQLLVLAINRRVPTFYRPADLWLEPLLGPVRRPARKQPAGTRCYHAALRMVVKFRNNIRSERLIFVSASLRRQYAAAGADVLASPVVHNGVSSDMFPLQRQRILSGLRPHRLVYVGRISPEKGITTLMKGLAELRRQPSFLDTTASVFGVFQGDGYEDQLQRLIRELGLRDAVTFAGRRPREEIAAVYGDHDVLVFPSEWQEPFGRTLIEAMSTAIPVLSTLAGGPSEFVKDNENAVVFEAGNARDLSDKLAWMLSRPQITAEIGRRASSEVRRRFDLGAQARLFEGVLSNGRPLPSFS